MTRPAFVSAVGALGTASSSLRSSFVCGARSLTHCRPTRAARSIHVHQQQYVPVRMQDSAVSLGITTESAGEEGTLEYRLFFKGPDGAPLSPWHDIPMRPTSDPAIVSFVNEIPKGMQAKMEIATDEPSNPIKQDVKKGALRFYKYGPSLVNYGAIPQTWEDPSNLNAELGVKGDGDPVDVTEIGSTVMPFGAVYNVKVLGCLGLLDEGEIDWKVIAINVDDPLASQMNDIGDVERLMPGRVSEVREWFRLYKTAEGKGENEYAYGGEAKDRDFCLGVLEETFQSWADLRSGKIANEDELALK